MEKSCLICFDDLPGISCKGNDCSNMYCSGCIERLVFFCEREKISPKCECGELIFETEIKKLKKPEVLDIYRRLVFNGLIDDNIDLLNDAERSIELIKKIRHDRNEFIMSTFSYCIKNTIDFCHKQKLQKIKRPQVSLKEETMQKKCFKLTCKGLLKSDKSNLVCDLCETLFCSKCEKTNKKNHSCDKNDVDNVEYMKTNTVCPKCNIPVEKISGCNDITCAICKTNFCYRTGEVITSGNHDDLTINLISREQVVLNKINTLYEGKSLDMVFRILDKINLNNMDKNTFVKKLIQNRTTHKNNIAHEYEVFRTKHLKYIRQSKVIDEIIETPLHISRIYEIMNNL